MSAPARSAVRSSLVPKWSSPLDSARVIYHANPIERIEILKRGVPALFADALAKRMQLPKERFYGMAGLARATIDRKIARRGMLSQSEGERVVGVAQLVGQVQNMVQESGSAPGFNPAKWTADWLERPHPALGGRRPGDLLDTAEGRGLVRDLLAKQQSGAYS